MADDVIFSRGDIRISKALAVFGHSTYPIANIGSVAIGPSGGGKLGNFGALLLLAGIVCFFIGSIMLALVLAGCGIALVIYASSEQTVTLKTSSGDVQALTTRDTALARQVKSAIEQAFLMRG